ncbi:MAG TPA: hypothetical protein VNA14_14070 [Mycobacteriales bacterium]|nr:hypothetical protein [Mycobacteriales bacterium]
MTAQSLAIDLAGLPHASFLTLAETAERLGCSTSDVYALVLRGDLRALCTPRTGLVVAEPDVAAFRSPDLAER